MEDHNSEEERQSLLINNNDMEVIVHSTLPSVGGRVTVATDPRQTVDSLITAFCIEKGIRHKKNYVLRNSEHDILENTKTLAASDVRNGEVLFIMVKEASLEWPCGCNQWWLLAALALVIGCVGTVAVSIIQVKGHKMPIDYGVVIDAGSSHTGTFVYKWPGGKDNGTGLVAELKACNTTPGISNHTDNPPDAGKSLEHCLGKAEEVVPDNQKPASPIYLGATAGMRVLEEADNETCQAILQSVRDTMKNTSFNFTHPEEQAKIITGAHEGVFSWVTVNYLLGTFGLKPASELLLSYVTGPGENPVTVGALDLGGASTEVTFVPQHPSDVPDEYKMSLTLYGYNHSVYTHSYLCYGVNEAHRQLLAYLVVNGTSGKAGNTTTFDNPCGPEGNTTSSSYAHVFAVPCTDSKFSFPGMDEIARNTTYHFKGTSDPDKCRAAVGNLFNTSAPCKTCTFDGVFQPPLYGKYKAFSNYYTATNFFNATGEGSTLEEFRNTRDDFCKKSWDEIRHMEVKPAYLVRECFNGFIVDKLLSLYGFNQSNWDTVEFVDKVNGATAGWSLGYMMIVTNMIPAKMATYPFTWLVFILLLVLFVLFIILAIGFACFARHSSKTPKEYKRLSTYGTV